MSKVKILIVGPVQGNIQVLVNKLKSLQSSKAGPFDVCFCVGPFFETLEQQQQQQQSKKENDEGGKEEKDDNETLVQTNLLTLLEELPLPVYIQNYVPQSMKGLMEDDDDDSSSNGTETTATTTTSGIVQLSKQLWHLRGTGHVQDTTTNTTTMNSANIWKLSIPSTNQDNKELVVASCPPHVRIDSKVCQPLLDKTKTIFSSGCDLLLTEEWPQGMEDMLQVDTTSVCFDTSQIALACKPRYHVATSSSSSSGGYQASPAYQIPGTIHHARFLALAPVIHGKTTKTNKYIHALGLLPLEGNPSPPTTSALPCPFGNNTINNGLQRSFRPIPPPPPPPLPPPPHGGGGGGGAAYSRFAETGRKRQRNDHQNDDGKSVYDVPDDPSISSLFLYGLHKDVTGELQSTSSPIVLQTFSKYNIQQVRHPPTASTSTYCFLEFQSQKDALACLIDCQAQITIKGVPLTLKWASGGANNKKRNVNPTTTPHHHPPTTERHFVTHAEAPQSTTLYFHPPKKDMTTTTESNTSSTTIMEESFAEELRKFIEQTLEDSMNADGGSDEERITAQTEPALAVSVRAKEKYGFLEFASHAAATMALAAITNSTDGGSIVGGGSNVAVQKEEANDKEVPGEETKTKKNSEIVPSHLVGTVLRWAKGETPKPKRTKEADYLEALGLERKHFPADSRTDCWFCLASPTCEKHMITSVYESCYTTMPKGPMHPGHILILPVTHSSQGVWTLGGQAGEEVAQIKKKLQRHASAVYDMDLFVFERAIQTRGGYHTHVQCVPVPRGLIVTLQTTMMAHAKASGFDLRPVQSDLGMTSLLNEDNQEEDYFYAELATEQQIHRFLYKASSRTTGPTTNEPLPKVPLQFGREVIASVLNEPKLAHWKSCIVDKEKEAELAAEFRQSLSSFEEES